MAPDSEKRSNPAVKPEGGDKPRTPADKPGDAAADVSKKQRDVAEKSDSE